ncbi:hypothetical protein [Oleisolibacter albus]|uniref:hypothetical protein n=1 Tax=Oleisolibacter albus TaxID=2171757 RepID=UPI000DF4C098|nr:hypothetical protein [Oleisolibacter albus]
MSVVPASRSGRAVACLSLALLTYGAVGLPAPPGLGPAELAVGLLLALALLPVCGVAPPAAPVSGTGLLLALAGLGLLRGAALDWGPGDLVRDVLPLGFLFLPVLLARAGVTLTSALRRRFALALALAGVLFALRWWLALGGAVSSVGAVALAQGQGYLLNSSSVAFAATLLPLWGLDRLRRLRTLPLGLAGLAGGLLALTALAASVHRAALLLALTGLGVGLIRRVVRRPALGPALLAAGLLVLPPLGGPVLKLGALAAAKTEAVGLNNRGAEWAAVLEQVGRDPAAFLLGDGWGALLDNPAVGHWRVSYTHNLASYMLLKTGALGLLLLAAYLGGLLASTGRTARRHPDLLLAALAPLAAGMLLHTSYKYLCFGLLLALLSLPERKTGKS